jgi:K+-sensing histidine kinase KdpD
LGNSQTGSANLIGIEFQDSGEGFSAEAAKRAVEPFYTTRTVGVGLGLTAAQKIVQDHGGIWKSLRISQMRTGYFGFFFHRASEGNSSCSSIAAVCLQATWNMGRAGGWESVG